MFDLCSRSKCFEAVNLPEKQQTPWEAAKEFSVALTKPTSLTLVVAFYRWLLLSSYLGL
jgi:hypothetical protein